MDFRKNKLRGKLLEEVITWRYSSKPKAFHPKKPTQEQIKKRLLAEGDSERTKKMHRLDQVAFFAMGDLLEDLRY